MALAVHHWAWKGSSPRPVLRSQEWEKRQKTRADETESVTKVEPEKHRISSAMEEKSSACHVKDELFLEQHCYEIKCAIPLNNQYDTLSI